MVIVGIDPSTYTGLVRLEDGEGVGKTVNFPKTDGWRRLQLIADEIDRILANWKPDVVVIEGYAYGNHNSLVTLVEIGTIIRSVLHGRGQVVS